MRKTFIKTIALFAVICLLFPCFAPAYAETTDSTGRNPNSRIIPGDIELDDPVIWEDGATAWTEIFSIDAVKVTDLLTSDENIHVDKSFRLSDLPSYATAILCEATLNHSLEGVTVRQDGYVQYGVCIYAYDYDVEDWLYKSVYINSLLTEELGRIIRVTFDIDEHLKSGETYYSFVKNFYGYDGDDSTEDGGYVYGTLTLYYS